MSPGQRGSATDILNEAARIRDALIVIEMDVDAQHTELLSDELVQVREKLGYIASLNNADAASVIDTRVGERSFLISPQAVDMVLPLTEQSIKTTADSREAIGRILEGQDDRLIVIAGPCSIHDPGAALEYATYIKEMRNQYRDDLEITMRAYSEKPRTEGGWKGFVSDPLLDESNDMNLGLIADRVLVQLITDMGVPVARERLTVGTPLYVNGLIAYDSIGARNVEDQNARGYASGTSSPVGFKNSTDGSVEAAISACVAANGGQMRICNYPNGRQSLVSTDGNPNAHVILRGGKNGPNYDESSIAKVVESIQAKNLAKGLRIPEGVVVDLSHQNKVEGSQRPAALEVARQIRLGSRAILGVMIESNLEPGAQKLDPAHPENLEYGISITDECMGLDETTATLGMLAKSVRSRRLTRHSCPA